MENFANLAIFAKITKFPARDNFLFYSTYLLYINEAMQVFLWAPIKS